VTLFLQFLVYLENVFRAQKTSGGTNAIMICIWRCFRIKIVVMPRATKIWTR